MILRWCMKRWLIWLYRSHHVHLGQRGWIRLGWTCLKCIWRRLRCRYLSDDSEGQKAALAVSRFLYYAAQFDHFKTLASKQCPIPATLVKDIYNYTAPSESTRGCFWMHSQIWDKLLLASSCPSECMELLGYPWAGFHKKLIFKILFSKIWPENSNLNKTW
jgi:hypothetical protein